jgi:hypothetical protein
LQKKEKTFKELKFFADYKRKKQSRDKQGKNKKIIKLNNIEFPRRDRREELIEDEDLIYSLTLVR